MKGVIIIAIALVRNLHIVGGVPVGSGGAWLAQVIHLRPLYTKYAVQMNPTCVIREVKEGEQGSFCE